MSLTVVETVEAMRLLGVTAHDPAALPALERAMDFEGIPRSNVEIRRQDHA
ncbi:hypothetical protein ACYX8G_19595 [Microbacterium saperdae]